MDIQLISGKKLKILLKRKGISQQELIKKFKFHQTTISRYFTDDQAMPASFIIKVAAYAGLTISDLIEGDPYILDVDYTEVAAEPQVTYITAPTNELPPPPIEITKPNMDDIVIAGLVTMIQDMRKQLDHLEQTMQALKEGKTIIDQ